MSVADMLCRLPLQRGVLAHQEILDSLHRLRAAGDVTNADVQRLLDMPSSRVSEIFAGKRKLQVDEAKAVVDAYRLEGDDPAFPPNAEMLEPILDALLPLAPPSGRLTDQSRRALAEALAYGLELLGIGVATAASPDALGVAARAAAGRFRERAT